MEALEPRLMLSGTSYVVDTAEDVTADDGRLSIREAMMAANLNQAVGDAPAGSATAPDTIRIADALSGQTILLNGTPLEITDDLTIIGSEGEGRVTLDAGGQSRILEITGSICVDLSGLGFTGGSTADDGGAIYATDTEALTISNSEFWDNEATGLGDGGALYVDTDGRAVIDSALFTGNNGHYGGAMSFNGDGTAELSGVTAHGNRATNGGAIELGMPSVYISGSLLYDNIAVYYGGVFYRYWQPWRTTELTVTSSTLANNQAKFGDAIYLDDDLLVLKNSVVVGNGAEDDDIRMASGTQEVLSSIVGGSTDGLFDLAGGDYRLAAGSPAINAGDNALAVDGAGDPLDIDLGGMPRIVGESVDIGAFEWMGDLKSLEITGQTTLGEGETDDYTCLATFAGGMVDVTEWAKWSVAPTTYAGMDGPVLTTHTVLADESATIQATYLDQTDTLGVVIKNTTRVLVSVTVCGATQVVEDGRENYSLMATYDDGSTAGVTSAAIWSQDSAAASIDPSGVLTAGRIIADEPCRITGGYGGMTDTRHVTILNTLNDAPVAEDAHIDVMAGNGATAFSLADAVSDTETPDAQLAYEYTSPAWGQLRHVGGGSFTFDPQGNGGQTTFTYRVTDTGDGSAPSMMSEWCTVTLSAGTILELDDRGMATWTDADGDLVSGRLTGNGTGRIILSGEPGDAWLVDLEGTDLRSQFIIAVKKVGGGDGTTTVGEIAVNGSLNRLNATKADLGGSFTATGLVRDIRLGDVADDHEILLNTDGEDILDARGRLLANPNITLGHVENLTIDTGGLPINRLRVVDWVDSDADRDGIAAPFINMIQVTGRRDNPRTAENEGIAANFDADLLLYGANRDISLNKLQALGAVNTNIAAAAGINSMIFGSLTGSIEADWINAMVGRNDRLNGAVNGQADVDLTLVGGRNGRSLNAANLQGAIEGGTWTLAEDAQTIRAAETADGWSLDVGGRLNMLYSLGDLGGTVAVDHAGVVRARGELSATLTATGQDAANYSFRTVMAGEVADATVTGPGGAAVIRSIDWQAGEIELGFVGTLQTTGQKDNRRTAEDETNAGDFGADVTLSGVNAPRGRAAANVVVRGDLTSTLNVTGDVNKVYVAGTADGARVQATGSINVLLLGKALDSKVFLGTAGIGAITEAGDFTNPGATLRQLSIRGIKGEEGLFVEDLKVAAPQLGKVSLLNADFEQDGSALYFLLPPEGGQTPNITYRDTRTGERWSWPDRAGQQIGGGSRIDPGRGHSVPRRLRPVGLA